IRALEPLTGIELMWRRRGVEDVRLLCSGPGRLCQALGIGLDDHGVDLTETERIWIAPGATVTSAVASGRIGVSRAGENPGRVLEAGSRFVPGHRRGDALAP